MRTTVNLPVAGACGPPVLPTALRAYGRNFDPPEGLRPSHRAYGAAAPSPIKQLSSHRAGIPSGSMGLDGVEAR